jgi:hypothetical protein
MEDPAVMEKRTARFSAGDMVKIRPWEEILRTLDADFRADGCLLTEQMHGCCGSIHRVLRVVGNVFDEFEFRMYGTRSPLYILEGLICDGTVREFERRCDRGCPLLWHESWLEKAGEKGT